MATRPDNSAPAFSDETTAATSETTRGTTNGRSEQETVREYRGTGIMWSAVALLVGIAALVIVIIQNTHDVTFEFLWFDADTPLSLILAITFGAALLLGELTGFVWRRRRRRRLQERDELRRLRSRSATGSN